MGIIDSVESKLYFSLLKSPVSNYRSHPAAAGSRCYHTERGGKREQKEERISNNYISATIRELFENSGELLPTSIVKRFGQLSPLRIALYLYLAQSLFFFFRWSESCGIISVFSGTYREQLVRTKSSQCCCGC